MAPSPAALRRLERAARESEIVQRFAAGAQVGELCRRYRLPLVDLYDILGRHGHDPNRVRPEDITDDVATIDRLFGKARPTR